MSDLFDNIKPGHTVHYLTPQGQTRKGRVVMNKGTHLVLNAGGKYGTPQVVTQRNFVKAQDGTRVTSALLSNVAKSVQKESVVGAVVGAGLVAAGAAGLYKNAKPKIKAYFKKKEAMKSGEKYAKQYAKDAAMYVANAKDPKRSKRSQSYHAKRAAEFINRSSAEADKVAKLRKEETVNEVSKELAKRYVIAAVKDINHSSREAEGARTAAYADYMNKKAVKRSNAIAKSTKAMRAYKDHVFGKDIYKEETVNELSTGKLTQYVSKAIADRKKAGREFEIASKDQYAATPAQDKSFARITKRSKGIAKAVGKIAKAYEETVNEVSAPGKEAWIKANKQRFIDRYGKEKGLRVLYAKAWKDSKTNEARESEWTANQQLAGQTRKKAAGHYLVRDGRTLSGPHKPHEAVAAYKGMSDNKGVKIVHVKETHMFDVTRDLLAEEKVEKAAKLAVNLKKKAKGKGHVNTEPALNIPDRTNTGTIEGNPEEQENAKV